MDKYLYKPNNSSNSYGLWMAYPACEAFALSSLGYMWLYKIADTDPEINAEMVCTDKASSANIKNAGAISFSMSFDFDFNGVFEIFDRYGIPYMAKDREDKFPLIFAGGPVITVNPAPYKAFFDFMLIGDGESLFPSVLDILKQKFSKDETLNRLSQIDGVYVPSVNQNKEIKKITEELREVIYTPVISDRSYFKDTFIIETARGCMNRCAFCTASYMNLPFRSYGYKKIIEAINLGLKHTDKIALLGAQVSGHPEFNEIIDYISDKISSGHKIELGISSLRADAVSPKLIKVLAAGGQKTSTIAIEAASERLRRFINKNLREQQILDAVRISRENGLKGLKIYSMIGIPEETDEDISEFLRLAKLLKAENKGFEITFSFSSFVPKPQTPFQWLPREDIKSLERKQKFLEKELTKAGIETKFSSIKWDNWQTVLSRGGEETAALLIDVHKNGGKIGAYKSAVKNLNLDITNALQGFGAEEVLPWDITGFSPDKEFLKKEYKRLLSKL